MREKSGRKGRLATKVAAVLVALMASFAFVNAASAADSVKSEFNDAWIKLPALDALTKGSIHALDPADTSIPKVNLNGEYDAGTGKVSYKASEFSFPRQSFEVLGGDLNLDIVAMNDFTGTYNKDTGALKVDLPLKLVVDGAGLSLKCELRPLNIGLDSGGAAVNFSTEDLPNNELGGAPFAGPSGAGSVIGGWTNVTPASNVFGVAAYGKTEATMTTDCKDTIALLTGGDANQSFDGIIWLGGTTTYTKGPDDPQCPAGQVGTYPDCKDPVTPGKISKITITKKATVKAGKKVKIKVKVTNSGGSAVNGKVALKSTNKKVKVPKKIAVKIAAGKTVTKTIVVKAAKKAKGKATITASISGKKAKSKITVKAAKKKKRK